jgi:phosphatidylserine/phosphatidylglycerophosphate/cardiolipin synthase-like enzyme
MRDLVPFAATIRLLAGSYAAALDWADVLSSHGAAAFSRLGLHGDAPLVLGDRARAVGILSESGAADRVRLAELVLVLDILERVPLPVPAPPAQVPLVFTVPASAQGFISPAERLDLLVTDVIARAEHTLHIGGPFWNAGGWDLLSPVLLPALSVRGVTAHFYLHALDDAHGGVVRSMLAEAREYGKVHENWWSAGQSSLMHAKFVIGDGARGYFGSANLTSLGLGEHLEIGVPLSSTQAHQLISLLDALHAAGFFTSPRSPGA